MEKMSVKEKTEREQKKLLRRELALQRERKRFHAEREFGLHYSVSYYRKYAPEEVERHWLNDLNNVKRILDEYESRLVETNNN